MYYLRLPVFLMLIGLVLLEVGCAPRTLVRKNPGPRDTGVRYYRPKPYLMLRPAVNKNGDPIEGYVSIETTTLPDFSEEYSIHVRSGLGTNNTSITLTDGWNLTALNVDVDSQFDENLEAVAETIKGIPTSSEYFGGDRIDIRGVNVPFGLYEAVVGKSGCKKQLYGFRYIGFLPYSNCPIEISGCETHNCSSTPLYGLVFDQAANVMVFKQIPAIETTSFASREIVKTTEKGTQEPPVLDDESGAITVEPVVSNQ